MDKKMNKEIKQNNKKEKRYYIREGCVGCGACKTVCPRHCISKGNPFFIHQDKCIKCGKCVNRCWRRLIILE